MLMKKDECQSRGQKLMEVSIGRIRGSFCVFKSTHKLRNNEHDHHMTKIDLGLDFISTLI